MVLFGKNVRNTAEPLSKLPVEMLYRALRNPKPETVILIRNLRQLRQLNKDRYSKQKSQLPFFVCGMFNPPFRKGDNFAYTKFFLIDIDKISDKQLSLNDLRTRLQADSRVMLAFVSPSGDGLKLMLRLAEPCYDKGLYSLFYKAFAHAFAVQYGLEQVIDTVTSDVARACFVSHDPDAYYNPNADPVDIGAYLPQADPTALFDLKHELEKQRHAESDTDAEQPADERQPKPDVDDEVMKKIVERLNPKAAAKPPKNIFVPEQLNDIMDDLRKFVASTGLEITEVINISYGKKIRMRLRLRMAEVNLFYSPKRGNFTVVQSPRTGTDPKLNELAAQLVQTFINGELTMEN